MTSIEHQQLKGITLKNLVVTIVSTASIVASVMTTYTNLQADIYAVKIQQDAQNRVNEVRLKVLEGQVAVLQTQVEQLQKHHY
jgi:hypothetical protein